MKSKDIIIVNTYPNSRKKLDLNLKYLSQLKKTGKDILLISHLPLNAAIMEMVTYFIYDEDNFLLPIEKCPVIWFADNVETVHLYSHRHCYAIVKNMYSSINFAKLLGYQNFLFTEYDVEMTDDGVKQIDSVFDKLGHKQGVVFYYDTTTEFAMYTNLFAFNIDFFLSSIPLVKSIDEWYTTYPYSSSTETIEILFAELLKPHMKDIYVEKEEVNRYFCNSNFNAHKVYETAVPIVYNMDNPARPLIFQITDSGRYQVYIDDKLVHDVQHPKDDWLKQYVDITNTGTKVQIFIDGKLRFESHIDLNSVLQYKNNGIVKQLL